MKRFLPALLLVALPAVATAGSDGGIQPLRVSLSLAWDGYIRPDRTTEATVRMLSPAAGPVDVELHGGGARTIVSADLEAGVPREIRIPVLPSPDRPILVTSPGRGDTSLAARYGTLVTRPAAVAVVSDTPIPIAPGDRVALLRPAPESLPRTPAAYDTVDVLVLDAGALARLDRRQRAALEGHLRACGRLVAVGLPPGSAAGIRANAGCGGQYLALIGTPDRAGAAVARMLADGAAALPTAHEMASLLPPRRYHPAASIGLFSLFYFVLLAAAAAAGKGFRWVAPIPVIAAAVAVAAWWHGAPQVYRAQWLVADAGDGYARYRGLVSVEGGGPNTAAVSLHPGMELVPPVPQGAAIVRDMRARGGRGAMRARFPTTLLSRTTLNLAGTVEVSSPFRIHTVKGGVEIINAGGEVSPAGVLRWKGEYFRLPALPPHGRWRPAAPTAGPAGTAALALLKDSARRPVLLVPYRAPARRAPAPGGWLLIMGAKPS